MHYYQKLINIIKIGVISLVITFIIITSTLSSPKCGQQELNLKSSVLISVGLGTSIGMVKFDRKKVNNYT
jgi:hypothetical protein